MVTLFLIFLLLILFGFTSHNLNFYKLITSSGYGAQPEKPSLVEFRPLIEVIYTNRDIEFMTFILRYNPLSIDNPD
jgi:hypothetical protein